MFTLSSHDKHSLLRMRYAFRSSEAISALIAAALLLPLVGLTVPIMVTFIVHSLLAGDLRRAIFGFFFYGAIALATLALWRVLDWFFSSAGCLVSVVSLIVSAIFIYQFKLSYTKLVIVAASSQGKQGDLGVTLSIVIFLATFSFFWRHTVRVGLLQRDERAVLTQRWPGQTVAQHFFGNLLASSVITRISFRAVKVKVVRVIANMIQGLSIYLLFAFFGMLSFHVTMLGIIAFDFFFKRSGPGSFEEVRSMLGYIIAFWGILLLAVFLMTQAAMALKRRARKLTRESFEETVRSDPRPPILFLRSFLDDQVTLPRPPLYVTYWLAEPTPRRLDHALVERFSTLAPFVAIGKPGEEDLPFGAARFYVPDDEWESKVKEFAASAHSIVVIADESPGVKWEVERMLEEPFVRKSFFLASPRLGNRGLEAHPLIGPVLVQASSDLPKDFRVLAAFRQGDSWRLLAIKKPTADDYIVSCQAFFRARFKDVKTYV